jgi:hypothetical protein
MQWGGWGSNPRPADYEKRGPTVWTHYLHRYHGAVSPMALIAPFARVARSTNRSTTYYTVSRFRLHNVTIGPEAA